MPNCPECVAREKNALKKQYQLEAEKAEEEGKDYLIPNDRDIGNDIEIPMKLDPSTCLLYTSPSPRDRTRSRMPSSA